MLIEPSPEVYFCLKLYPASLTSAKNVDKMLKNNHKLKIAPQVMVY